MYTSEGKKIIRAEKAPQAIGPYSVAVQAEAASLIFCSGQLGLDPASGALVEGGVAEQTRQALTNLQNVLEAAETGLNYVLKTTVFLVDMNDFAAMNAVYGEFFPENAPARSTVAVAGLPKGARVEIEAVAMLAPSHGD